MKKAVSRTVRITLTVAILAGLVLFARKVNWSTTWASITEASGTILLLAAVVNLASLALASVMLAHVVLQLTLRANNTRPARIAAVSTMRRDRETALLMPQPGRIGNLARAADPL